MKPHSDIDLCDALKPKTAKLVEIVTTMKALFKGGLFFALLLCSGTSTDAQGSFSVVSTNDGNGQFNWTFGATGGSFPMVYQFKMKLYGVQETFSPQGWAATIDADEFVTWSYLGGGGAPFTGSPMTVSIRSTSIESIFYGGIGNLIYPDGLYSGDVFGRFMYEGPVQVPEPSGGLLWLLAAGIAGAWRRIGRSSCVPGLCSQQSTLNSQPSTYRTPSQRQ